MDTTPEYIKMCVAAVEIQALAPGRDGTYFEEHNFIADELGNIAKEDNGYYYMLSGEKHIWLPRQDELQEMVKESSLSESLTAFYHWNYDIGFIWKSDKEFTSMEQLWLAYVMQELYQKTWNGSDWVKEEN